MSTSTLSPAEADFRKCHRSPFRLPFAHSDDEARLPRETRFLDTPRLETGGERGQTGGAMCVRDPRPGTLRGLAGRGAGRGNRGVGRRAFRARDRQGVRLGGSGGPLPPSPPIAVCPGVLAIERPVRASS